MLELNPDALAIAADLDAERAAGNVRGPLHGIPVSLKGNIGTADLMHTSAGAVVLADNISDRDSGVATRLRDAGAVLIGKANLSEWAGWIYPALETAGFSALGGFPVNPFDPALPVLGSSSGSAVGTSANLVAASVGTETAGSLIAPASANGVVGMHPSLGLVSRDRVIPLTSQTDTPGPVARTVADAATMLTAIAGVDERIGSPKAPLRSPASTSRPTSTPQHLTARASVSFSLSMIPGPTWPPRSWAPTTRSSEPARLSQVSSRQVQRSCRSSEARSCRSDSPSSSTTDCGWSSPNTSARSTPTDDHVNRGRHRLQRGRPRCPGSVRPGLPARRRGHLPHTRGVRRSRRRAACRGASLRRWSPGRRRGRHPRVPRQPLLECLRRRGLPRHHRAGWSPRGLLRPDTRGALSQRR